MFRRYPYWGWLVLSLLLWCINGYNYHLHRRDMLPEQMTRTVANDLGHREDVFEGFAQEHDLIRRLFTDSLSERESEKVNNFPFYVYAYDRDSLKYWNTSVFTPAYILPA